MRNATIDKQAGTANRFRVAQDPALCVLVLAGGEGKRLRPFIHLLRGDLLPKQYVNFIGRRSMLEHTLDRAEKLTPGSQVFTIVNQHHLAFADVRKQLANRHPGTVIVQPENKETAPGILFGLMQITKRYPDCIVTLLPSDHFVLEEDTLIGYLKFANVMVKRDPSRVMLLGVEPDREESEYGYIVHDRSRKRGAHPMYAISSFVEKPDRETAEDLTHAGALWNTMMMVFKASALLDWIKRLTPAMFNAFERIYEAIGTADEHDVVQKTYRRLLPINFSKEVLEPLARKRSAKLATFPVRNVLWSDWGSESRIMEVLRKTGNLSRLNGLEVPADVSAGVNLQPASARKTRYRSEKQRRGEAALTVAP
jgi:mannose-1-phosphate guanylyltransferase